MTLSSHPVDVLIRELIRTNRSASADEIERIVERMAIAPFDPRDSRVRVKYRGTRYQGRSLGSREPSLFYHLVKRVMIERQWAHGTTEREYLEDVRQAVRSSRTGVAVYERQQGIIAATISETDPVVPSERRGAEWLPLFLVIYSADRGIIVTGYQISGFATANIPEEAQWLR